MRVRFEEPVEYVVSRLQLKDRNEKVATGFIVSPRYKGDEDDKFCGVQGDLDIRIEMSASNASDAYEYASKTFDEIKKEKRVLEEFERKEAKRKT
jgi:hypothetical protein